MRTEYSIRNSIVSIISIILTMFFGFLVQKVFLNALGTEYLGLNGLFNNIITMLSIVELGIGPAIICNLYEPVAKNNISKIKSLVKFYKICYRIIALIIFIISICLIPFLNIIVGENSISQNIYIIYLVFVMDTIMSYLLTYKRSVLYANQKNYIINMTHLLITLFMNIIQITILKKTYNYILFLIIRVLLRVTENMIITIIVNRMYPYLKEEEIENIDKGTKESILNKVKGLIFHKIGGFMVTGTDNMLISSFIGISEVGIYSNYLLIINAINTLITQVFTSISSSIGNLIITENKNKIFEVYLNINFINFIIAIFGSISLLFLLQPFITLWVGEQYLFSFEIIIVLVLNFFITIMRRSINIFKEAAGVFYEDRFLPIIESIINIVTSIIFIKLFGIIGVFLGTILSNVFLYIFDYPKYAYEKLFNRKEREFIIKFIKQISIFIVIALITYCLCLLFKNDNLIIVILYRLTICIVVTLLFIFFNRKKSECKFMIEMLKKFISSVLKNKKTGEHKDKSFG